MRLSRKLFLSYRLWAFYCHKSVFPNNRHRKSERKENNGAYLFVKLILFEVLIDTDQDDASDGGVAGFWG